MNDPLTLALVFVGGAGGSAIRWLVGIGVGERHKGSAFPLATFLINVSGAFVMGLLSTLLSVDWKDRYGSNLTALVLTGVLGGYTTFSSYSYETIAYFEQGHWWFFAANVIGNNVLCLAATLTGIAAARAV